MLATPPPPSGSPADLQHSDTVGSTKTSATANTASSLQQQQAAAYLAAQQPRLTKALLSQAAHNCKNAPDCCCSSLLAELELHLQQQPPAHPLSHIVVGGGGDVASLADSVLTTAADFLIDVQPGQLPTNLPQFIKAKKITVIGAQMGSGQEKPGVELAPLELRRAGLFPTIEDVGYTVVDGGNVHPSDTQAHLLTVEEVLQGLPESMVQLYPLERKSQYYDDKLVQNGEQTGQTLEMLFDRVLEASKSDTLLLTLGGDHSIAFATVGAMLTRYPDLCVLWIDAHGDCNTPETSSSAHYHGMPVGHLMGWFQKEVRGFEWAHSKMRQTLSEDSLAYVGLRDIDKVERQMLRKSRTKVFTMQHIDRWGIAKVIAQALAMIDPMGTRPLHISLDIDGCDPTVAPGTGTTSRGGLNYREIHYLLETVAATGRLVSMDLVEINPAIDVVEEERLHGDLATINDADQPIGKTVKLGIECIRSALGGVIV